MGREEGRHEVSCVKTKILSFDNTIVRNVLFCHLKTQVGLENMTADTVKLLESSVRVLIRLRNASILVVLVTTW